MLLAVAGGRKTQRIVESIGALPANANALCIGFTLNCQDELRGRLREHNVAATTKVLGWYSFLYNYFVKPYLPSLSGIYDAANPVQGIHFQPVLKDFKAFGRRRYFTTNNLARTCTLSELVRKILDVSGIDPISRLADLHDFLYVDEVQDLTGSDLEILERCAKAGVNLRLVGDPRQAVLSTNRGNRKNQNEAGIGIRNWGLRLQLQNNMTLSEDTQAWRYGTEIAQLADRILPRHFNFPPTASRRFSPHAINEGTHTLLSHQVLDYLDQHPEAIELRWDKTTPVADPTRALNFVASKGLTLPRTIIYVPKSVQTFLLNSAWVTGGEPLSDLTASKFYVAITRAEYSLALVVDAKTQKGIPVRRWGQGSETESENP